MKALLALLLSSALCFAAPVAHAESAESGSPAGGAGERSEPEGVSHAENAETAEPEPRAEPVEGAAVTRPLRSDISANTGGQNLNFCQKLANYP